MTKKILITFLFLTQLVSLCLPAFAEPIFDLTEKGIEKGQLCCLMVAMDPNDKTPSLNSLCCEEYVSKKNDASEDEDTSTTDTENEIPSE